MLRIYACMCVYVCVYECIYVVKCIHVIHVIIVHVMMFFLYFHKFHILLFQFSKCTFKANFMLILNLTLFEVKPIFYWSIILIL